jgi:ATP-binding cassette, subfamily C (CFTR/MRP), member 1
MANYTDCAVIDRSFGPYAQSCRGGFDFTVLFEESILTLAPIGFVILISPFRIVHLLQREKKVAPNTLGILKLVSSARGRGSSLFGKIPRDGRYTRLD